MVAAGRERGDRLAALALAALAAFFLAAIAGENFIDPDAYHLMALFREALALGRMPVEDRFAYTETVRPCIQHEWGTGALLYVAARTMGASGILAWKYGLAALLALAVAAQQRRAKIPVAVFASLAPLGVLLVATGFSTVRAQVFTLVATAVLLACLARDRSGDRRWILPWLLVHVLWLNLHAGFVVGSLLFALHVVEQRLRGAPVRHLLATLFAMLLFVLANPYGLQFVPAVFHGLTLDRSIVTEWDPVWRENGAILAVFAFALLVSAYAIARSGWRRTPGVLLLAATAAVACAHQRHLSIFGVAWISIAPGWIGCTPLGAALARAWGARRRTATAAFGLLLAASACAAAARAPWRLRIPANPGDHETLLYPAGAVDYLREQGFAGNLMVPFTVGAFVSWELHPRVRVSFDSRFEVAYPPRAAAENRDFYAARGDWRGTLAKDPTDAVLVPRGTPVEGLLTAGGAWKCCYRDDAYAVFARPDLDLAPADRCGMRIPASFP